MRQRHPLKLEVGVAETHDWHFSADFHSSAIWNVDIAGVSMQIADFGTTQWAQNTASTGLATYTKRGHGIHLSLQWAAPEVSFH